ncbi:MAG: hypothetical protein MK160_07970 [Rhodobacteraceae bacterium]|nr:hypothetical protein [Paracoccaceae bacterium]
MADRWHIQTAEGMFLLARHWPPRFDIAGEAVFPEMRADRLARQIRQDMWRRLQHIRGFSPVVEIRTCAEGLRVRAGGRAAIGGTALEREALTIVDLLNSPSCRRRWARWARL